jgi:hypothetical protein
VRRHHAHRLPADRRGARALAEDRGGGVACAVPNRRKDRQAHFAVDHRVDGLRTLRKAGWIVLEVLWCHQFALGAGHPLRPCVAPALSNRMARLMFPAVGPLAQVVRAADS